MRIRLLLAASIFTVALALAVASEGQAQKPPKPGATTLKASADKVTFSTPVALTGKVKGGKQGIPVALERHDADQSRVRARRHRDDRRQRRLLVRAAPVGQLRLPRHRRHRDEPGGRRGGRAARRPEGLATPRRARASACASAAPCARKHNGTRVAIQRKRADGTWVTVRIAAAAQRQRLLDVLQADPDPPQRHLPHRDRGARGPRRGRQPRADADGALGGAARQASRSLIAEPVRSTAPE